MDIRDAFPSKYFNAGDLDGKDKRLVIGQVVLENIQGTMKPVIYFHGHDKALVLNVTNSRTIEKMYGPETAAWLGKPITLYTAEIEFKGEVTEGVRIRAFATKPSESRAPESRPLDPDDKIPF